MPEVFRQARPAPKPASRTLTSREQPFEPAEHCQSPLSRSTNLTSKYAPALGLPSDTPNTIYRCSPVPSHASRPPLPVAASTPPLARWARPTTTPRALAATFPSTLSPSGSLLGTGLSWVRARERERHCGLGHKRLTIGTAVGFGAPFGIAGKFLELWKNYDRIADGIRSLADLQELEDELLMLEEGITLWWCTWWRPPGLGGGLYHTGICNVYNTEFPSSHCQTLSTYMSQPFPMYRTAAPVL
jgi:hypothetical protein